MVEWEDLKNLLKVLKSNPAPLDNIYEIPVLGTIKLGQLIGRGRESLVYDIDRKSRNNEDLVAKFYESRVSHRAETEALEILKGLDVTLECHGSRPGIGAILILTKGVPWKETMGAARKPPISLKSFSDLLEVVQRVHSRNIIHRDIRPANIYFVGQRVVLGDFASFVFSQTSSDFEGSWTTASQNSLKAGIKKQKHFYRPVDDIESVFKTYFLWKSRLKIPLSTPRSRKRDAYLFWDEFMAVCQLDRNASLEQLVSYLRTVFAWSKPAI
jgi:serine/threonine protein kinase